MKSIIIIIPYFGKLPKMFHIWKASALANATIDFLIITDDESVTTEKNIKILHSSFKECKRQIQSVLGFDISLDSPYKLCDYRPTYGCVFSSYTKKYDFWGFGDMDLVYGNIRYFLTDDILNSYWVISGWGHFTLYKNNNYCNNFFKTRIKGFQYYKDVFTNSKNCVFDEYLHHGMGDMWKEVHPDKVWDSRLMDDIVVPWNNFHFVSYHRKKDFLNMIMVIYIEYLKNMGK